LRLPGSVAGDRSGDSLQLKLLSAVADIGVCLSVYGYPYHGLYPGDPTAEVRRHAEDAVNSALGHLCAGLPLAPWKSCVLSEFVVMLNAFENDDTEEREQACAYCERIMGILGLGSSGGLLNNRLYGFDILDRSRRYSAGRLLGSA